jgi:hypothetical protein
MAKVVRAFSIDPEVARMIDRIAERDSSWSHRPNKSRVVNQALRWYYLTDIAEIIEDKDEQIDYWKNQCLSKQGGNGHLSKLFALFRKKNA